MTSHFLAVKSLPPMDGVASVSELGSHPAASEVKRPSRVVPLQLSSPLPFPYILS